VQEQNKTIAELWDGVDLKCSFRRCVDVRLFNVWEEIVSRVESLNLNDEEDELLWMHSSSGIYSSHSLYSVINFRGDGGWGGGRVTPIYVSAVWKLLIPPRVHFFLWLLSKNQPLTRDNLEKRRLDDNSCLFCTDQETFHHLFFGCAVAKRGLGNCFNGIWSLHWL
jgi:hypothetical protein